MAQLSRQATVRLHSQVALLLRETGEASRGIHVYKVSGTWLKDWYDIGRNDIACTLSMLDDTVRQYHTIETSKYSLWVKQVDELRNLYIKVK